MVSSWASGEPGCHTVSRGPGGLLFCLMWRTHTLGSAVPHNYTKCTSLKMLISPLDTFRAESHCPHLPWLRGPAHDSQASTFLQQDCFSNRGRLGLGELGNCSRGPFAPLGPESFFSPKFIHSQHAPAPVPAPTRCHSPLGVPHGPGLFSLLFAALHQASWLG